MRPSLARVRSWVSSTVRPSESTLVFTSPTRVLTNFLVAHAVEPASMIANTGTATTILLITASSCLQLRRSGPAAIAGQRAHRVVTFGRSHRQRPPSGRAGLEGEQILMSELAENLSRRPAAVRGRAGHVRRAAVPVR